MRINAFIAQATGFSRRGADQAIIDGKVQLNGQPAKLGDTVTTTDRVTLNGQLISPADNTTTIMLNKPVGYVCSRDGQGSQIIYNLLPPELQNLKPVGRLDKDSSGLLLLTNDGQLANRLTHPRYAKIKIYEVELDKPLSIEDKAKIEKGVQLEDGLSVLKLKQLDKTGSCWQISMTEGRNRQIRRTLATLGYQLKTLHRTHFGPYTLSTLAGGTWRRI